MKQLLKVLLYVGHFLTQGRVLLHHLGGVNSGSEALARGSVAKFKISAIRVVFELEGISLESVRRVELLRKLLVQRHAVVTVHLHLQSDRLWLGRAVMLAPPVTEEVLL